MLTFIVLVGFFCLPIHGNNDNILSYNEAKNNIINYVNSQSLNVGIDRLCQKNTCCTLSETETCDIDTLTPDATTLILPGGETRCIYSTSTPYAFQVIPGDSNNLLIYYQGGGACWNEASTNAGFCSTSVSPSSLVGVFDRENKLNPYKDYTIIQALYCSGDLFGGNVTQSYTDSSGVPIIQMGIYNAQATLDWILLQQQTSKLSTTLSNLVIMGASAGAIGAQIWATTILDTLSWENAAIIPDSYAGVFPEGTQGPLVKDLGFCSWDKLPQQLYDSCIAETLTLQEIVSYNLKYKYPSVPVAFIQSKVDATQQSFYVAVGYSMNVSAVITPSEFYADVNEIFGEYNQYSNFVSYLVDGTQHCFTNNADYYTADGLDPKDNNSTSNSDLTLIDWINGFPIDDSESVHTVCIGDLALKSEVGKDDVTYCSSSVYPKTFTV